MEAGSTGMSPGFSGGFREAAQRGSASQHLMEVRRDPRELVISIIIAGEKVRSTLIPPMPLESTVPHPKGGGGYSTHAALPSRPQIRSLARPLCTRTFQRLDFGLEARDGVRGAHVQGERAALDGLDEDLVRALRGQCRGECSQPRGWRGVVRDPTGLVLVSLRPPGQTEGRG